MARFLFTVFPFAGCVNPQIAVAEVLAKRGHSIAFYTGRHYKQLIEGLGFTYFPFHKLDENLVDRFLLSSNAMGRNWERPWRLRPQVRGFFLDTVPQQIADMEAIMERWAPDAITTDPAMWAPFLVIAEHRRMPVALLSYAAGCMLPGKGLPPNGLGLPLPRNPWLAAQNAVVGLAMDFYLADTRRAATALRATYGLSPVEGPVIGLARNLPLYLLPSCPEFDYNRTDLPPSVQYVGPLQWYPPPEPQPWLDSLPTDKPWIHVTEGTLHVREPFLLRAAAQGLSGLPMEVIMTTGDQRTLADLNLGLIGSNIHVARWVNHSDLLPRTSVMIATAGGGVVAAGMGAGVPMLVVPTEWDKAENAQRVVEAGAGIRMSPGQCSPKRVRAAVEKILAHHSYRDNARRIAALFQRQGGPARAASLLEGIV